MNVQQLLPLDDSEEKGRIDCNRDVFEMFQSGKYVPVPSDTNNIMKIFQYRGAKGSTLIFQQLRGGQLQSNHIFKCGGRIFFVFMIQSGMFFI